MDKVARHLQTHALGLSPSTERDYFGRSAFNRYYYAMFLETRAMLKGLNPDWGLLPHKSYPELLRGTICREFDKGRHKAVKAKDQELIISCGKALAAAKSLATLMEIGYGIRTIADYSPEIEVIFLGGDRFSLTSVNITDAHNWTSKARAFCAAIRNTWTQVRGF